MEEQDYTYPGYDFADEDKAIFLGDYTGLRLLMWARLFPDRITLVDDIDLVQDVVTRDRIERWRRHGWSDVSEGRTYLFVPNIDYVGQVDRHALFSLVSNYGLEGLLDKEGLDAFLRLVRSHNAVAVEQLSASAGIKDMNQATMSFIRNAVGGYRAAQQPTEKMEHLLESIFRDLTAACPAFCDLNNGSDDDPMEKLHIGIHTLMSVLPEALTEHWRKSRQWRLAISPEDLAEGNDDEFRHMEARRDDLSRQPNGSIIFGTPSNALLYSSVRMKDYPIVLPYRSLFGYNGRDKQAVHPYRFDELVGLTTDIADPVAVFNAKTQGGVRSESVVVLSRLTHMEDNGEQKQFVVPISPRRDETYGSLNIVRSVYPKDDLDIMLWIAEGYLSYASDDFVQTVYNPMKKRLLADEDISNEIKGGKMDIHLPVESHRSRPDALRPDAESPHKEGTDSPRRSVYSVSAVADERTDAKIGNNSYPVNKISSMEDLFEVADYMVERAAAGIGESDSRNIYFRVGGDDASRLDLISQADSAVRIARSPAAAAILAMEKRSRIERYLEGIKTTPYRILNAGDPLSLEGCPAGIRDRIASAIASGLEINGFAYEGTVYVIADFIRSSEQLRSTYVHERQHILTEAEGLEDLAGVSRSEAFDILSRLTPEASVYEGRSTASLLSEAVSYAMEIAYSGNDDMADVLTALGITNENFKNHIQRLDYAQRHDDNLCRARYDSLVSKRFRGDGTPVRGYESQRAGEVARQRARSAVDADGVLALSVASGRRLADGESKPYYYVSSAGGIIPSEDMPLTVYDTVEEAAMDIHGQNGDFFLHRVFINEKDGPVGAQFKCSDPSRLREIGDPVILSPDVTMSFANAFQKSENIPYPSSEDLELPEDTRLPDDKDADYRITRRNEDTVTGWYYKWFDSAVAAKRIPHDDFLMDGDAVSNRLYLLSQASGDERESLLASYRESQKNSFVSYISSLEGSVLQLSAARWFTMGKVRLPEDIDKVSQAVKVAAVHKVDPLTYETPMAVIDAFPSQARKDSPIDPDTVSTLHLNRRLDSGIAIYDVDESEDSRQNMRRIINTHFGKDCSPWCLLAGDQDGNLRPGTRRYWDHYSRYKKQVAFMDGRLVAFSANNVGSARYRTWWDRMDSPSSFIRRVSGMDYCGFDMNTGRLREKREDGHCLFYDEKGRLRRDGGKEYHANGRLKKDGYLRFYANGNVQWDGKTAYWSTGNPKQVTYSEKELPADIRKLLEGKWRNERYIQKCTVNYAANGTVKNIRVEDHDDPPRPGWNPCWPSRLVSFYPYSPGAVPVKRKEMLLNQHDSNNYEYTYRTWYPDGKLRVVADKVSICGADEHNRRGHYVSYYPNGNVKFEGDYDPKLPESVRQSFWPDGSPRQREVYTHNGYEWKLRDSSSWYENGKTRSTVEMIGEDDSGQREYRIKIYRPDSTLKTDADNATMVQRVVNGKVSAVIESPRRKDYDTDGHILSEVHNDTSIKYNDDGLPLRYARRESNGTSIILTMDGNKPASLRVSRNSDVLSFSLSETGGVTGGKQSVLKTVKINNDKLRTVYAEQTPLSDEQLSAVSDAVLQFVKHAQDLSDDGSTNHLTFRDFRIALGQFSQKEYTDLEDIPFRMNIPVGIDDAASDTNDISEWVATLSEDERKSLLRQNGLSEDLSLEGIMNGDVAVDGNILVGLYGNYISSVEKQYAYRPGLVTDITKTVQPVGKNDIATDARLGKMEEYELAMNRWRRYKWYEKLFIPRPKKPKAELKDTQADDAQRPNNGLTHTGNESKPEPSPIHYGGVSRKDIEILESYRLLSAGDGSLERFIAEIEKKKEVVVTGNMTYQRTHTYDPALLPTQKVCIGLRMDPSGSLVVFNPGSRKELGTVRNVLSQVPHDGTFAVKPREVRKRRAEKEIRHQESAARSPRRSQPG